MKRRNSKGLSLDLRAGSILFALALLTSTPSFGQLINATLSGSVTDPSGAVVPEATLTVTNISTGVSTRVVSGSAGDYVFAQLAPGTYTLSVEKAGFAGTLISGISLNVDQRAVVDVVLKVGEVTQSVQVEGAAPLVETTTASLGTVVDEQPILDLPLNLRRIGTLALVVPRTVDTTGRSLTSANGNGSGFNDNSYSAAGGRSTGNLILIDGMISRALNNGGFALQPVPEMVKEFKIESNNYNAAFGLSSGSTMNLITESGTNSLHGSAWEYMRNRDLDARNFFAVGRPEFIRNQFGAALGGPIRKNKTFFFGSYEGLRLIQGQTVTNVVPTAAEKGGNFASFLTGQMANLCASSGSAAPSNLNYDTGQLFYPATQSLFTCPANPATPGTPPAQVLVGTPIPGNVITNIDPVAQKVLALFPASNRAGGLNFVNQTPLRRPDDQFDARVDEVFSDKDRLFGRYLFGNTNQLFPGGLPAFNNYQHYRGQNVVVGWAHIFSPSLINDVRVGYQRGFLDLDCQGCPRQPGLLASFVSKT